jgi:small GTP-binding protein
MTSKAYIYSDKFNVMIIGDDKVGKTSILKKFGNINEEEKSKFTRVENYNKEFKYKDNIYLFRLWDTVSKDKFNSISKAFYQKADCIILICAINDRESFLNINKWVDNIKNNIELENIEMILIGNKCDLEDERQVGLDEIVKKGEDFKIESFETSAKTGEGVEDAFETLFTKVLKKVYQKNKKSKKNVIKEEKDTSSDSSQTCFIY